MRTSIVTSALLFFILLGSACNKDKEEEPTTPAPSGGTLTIKDFSLLEVGNYWVYERHGVDSLGNDNGAPVVLDSVYVAGDSVVDGQTWMVMRRTLLWSDPFLLARDSADCMVGKDYGIQFKTGNMGSVFELDSNNSPIQAVIHWSADPQLAAVQVPAGDFNGYIVTGQVDMYGLPFCPVWKYPRRHWVQGVGLVQRFDYFSLGTTGFRFDLVRYHVQ